VSKPSNNRYPLYDFVCSEGLAALFIHGPTDQAIEACEKLALKSYTAAQVPMEKLQEVAMILEPVIENTSATRDDIWKRLIGPFKRIQAVLAHKQSQQMNNARSWTDDATD